MTSLLRRHIGLRLVKRSRDSAGTQNLVARGGTRQLQRHVRERRARLYRPWDTMDSRHSCLKSLRLLGSGANLQIDPMQLARIDLWSGASHLMLQNEVREATNIAAAQAARERGIIVCLNAAPWRTTSEQFLDLVDILVVNALEAEALCGTEVAGLETAGPAAGSLAGRFATVVVTAGGEGVALAAEGRTITLPAQKVSLVSTHGAGDCFIGTFVARLAAGDDREVALAAANSAAARHVSRSQT